MNLDSPHPSLIVVVGAGGVGKTTLAAALGLNSAASGRSTLVMTFDPSRRLKDTLGVGRQAEDQEVEVAAGTPGRLAASLLDARRTFDRLVWRYAPDEAAARRILDNRFYHHLAGNLAGVLEYMAVERLFEVAADRRYDRVILDTPPTRQALDFLQAPDRIVGFLDSGAVKLALHPWFDKRGRVKAASRVPFVGRKFESFLDRIVGLDLLRELAEFFQAFAPLYGGFRGRAQEVQRLLRAPETLFVLVTRPGEEAVPEALFFARQLLETGHNLGPIVVNMVNPAAQLDLAAVPEDAREGLHLLAWLGERDQRGLAAFRRLLPSPGKLVDLPMSGQEPTTLPALEGLG
ncbi:MAG: ArsA family ATPase, partial [Acidobacteria bacterium]